MNNDLNNPDGYYYLNNEFAISSDFCAEAERFGGVLDLGYLKNESINVDIVSVRVRQNTRFLFMRPLSIFNEVIARIAAKDALRPIVQGIKAAYILNAIPNAFCWKSNNCYYIGVTSGLVHLINGWTSSLFSVPDFLGDLILGSDEEETADLSALREGFDLGKIFEKNPSDGLLYGSFRIPKSDVRLIASKEATQLAVLHVFMHELGHCLLGHTDYHGGISKNSSLKEVGGQAVFSFEQQHLMHVFELMADNFAIELFLAQKIVERNCYSREDAYALWSLGTDIVLWLLGYNSLLSDLSISHPHVQVRMLNKFLQLGRVVNKKDFLTDMCTLENGQKVPVDKFCQSISLKLARTWESMRLPGYTASWADLEGKSKYIFDLFRETAQHKSEARQQYECTINWNTVYTALEIDGMNDSKP